MKFILMLVLALFTTSMAVEVPDSLIPADLRAKLNANAKVTEATANVEVARQYVGLGHEVGVAVNDAMSAITEQANKFANTEVGHPEWFGREITTEPEYSNIRLAERNS